MAYDVHFFQRPLIATISFLSVLKGKGDSIEQCRQVFLGHGNDNIVMLLDCLGTLAHHIFEELTKIIPHLSCFY